MILDKGNSLQNSILSILNVKAKKLKFFVVGFMWSFILFLFIDIKKEKNH